MNFLDKLDFMMNKLDINRSKLSNLSGVPYTTIDTLYKKGYENTKLSTIKKIAEALDVSMDYLLVDSITDESYGKTVGFSVDFEEQTHIKKYRSLDPYGKEAVDSVLDVEWRRCAERAKPKIDIDAEAVSYRAELELQEEVKEKSSAFDGSSGTGEAKMA